MVRNYLAHFNKNELISLLKEVEFLLKITNIEAIEDTVIKHGITVLRNSDFNVMYNFLKTM